MKALCNRYFGTFLIKSTRIAGCIAAMALFLACGGETGNQGNTTSAGVGGSAGASSGSSSSGEGGSGGSSSNWAGVATGDPLIVQIQLAIRELSPTSNYVLVSAFDTVTNKQLSGATVTLTPLGGMPVTLGGGGATPYQTGFAGDWAPSYELSIEHPSASRKGIVLVPPSVATLEINPPPKVNTPTTITWMPNNEDKVGIYILFGSYGTPTATPLPDNGSFEVPATAFPKEMDLVLELQRVRTSLIPNELTAQIIVSSYKQGVHVNP